MQMREKVGKSRNTVFFQWCVAPEGRKVGSVKRRVRSQLERCAKGHCQGRISVEMCGVRTWMGLNLFGLWTEDR